MQSLNSSVVLMVVTSFITKLFFVFCFWQLYVKHTQLFKYLSWFSSILSVSDWLMFNFFFLPSPFHTVFILRQNSRCTFPNHNSRHCWHDTLFCSHLPAQTLFCLTSVVYKLQWKVTMISFWSGRGWYAWMILNWKLWHILSCCPYIHWIPWEKPWRIWV